jgi:hypothetical protein
MTNKKTAAPVSGAATSTQKKAAPKTTTKSPARRKPSTPKKTAPKAKEEVLVNVQEESTVSATAAPEEQPSRPKGHVVVIPYIDSKAAGKELLFALRAWENNFEDLAGIVVVGDLPEGISREKVTHIPHRPESNNPQVDVAQKMAAAIASDLVPEVFIWSNDDIYPIAPVSFEDIAAKKSIGILRSKGKPGGVYHQNSIRTMEAIKKAGLKNPKDYATHTPVVFEKSKLAKTIADFGATKEGLLVSTLYFNQHYPLSRPIVTSNGATGSIVASVWSANPNRDILERVFQERSWINNNDLGYPIVEPYLIKLFPKKSRFEK